MSNFNTSGLLQALDRIKPDLKPLPQHFITCQDQHTRELYATLLAAVLLSDGQVSEPQSRLFGMLLQSMQLEPVPARFFELAQQLDAGQLKDAIRGIQPVKESFAVDALILARLKSPLHQQQLQMIAELFDALDMIQEIASITEATAFVLGLGDRPESSDISVGITSKSPILKELWNHSEAGYLFNKGIWTDPATGLMWSRISIGQQCKNNQVQGKAQLKDWHTANQDCKTFRLADFDDWRIPTEEELNSLMINKKAGYASPEGVLFQPEQYVHGKYWTSSAPSTDSATIGDFFPRYSMSMAMRNKRSIADFSRGHFDSANLTDQCYVRAVRDIAKKNPSEPTGFEIQI